MTCIDLHHFFFIAWRKEASPTRNRNIYNYCCMSISILHKLSLLFLLVCPPFQKRPSPTVAKKCKKARKLGRKDGSAEKGTRKKFRFWERFVFDRHRPTFDLHQKDAKKPEKLGKCRSMYLIYILYAREKKSKNFFYIERYGNDLHRPTSFLFHRLEERSFSHTKQKPLCRLTFLVVLSYNKEKTTAENNRNK